MSKIWNPITKQWEEQRKVYNSITKQWEDKSYEVSAPIKTTNKKKERTWFSSGGFEDGYDVGDITKTILGTTADIGTNVVKGAANVGEGIGDLISYGVAGVSDKLGFDDYAELTRKEAKRNMIEEWFKPLDDAFDEYSLIGEKGDSISQGIGNVLTMIGTGGLAGGLGKAGSVVSKIAPTVATTGLSFASGTGSGMSEAYQGGATDNEALKYGLISGVADAGTELIFGGLGKTVNAVGLSKGISSADDMLAQKVGSMFKNQLAKNLSEYTIKAGAEGLEEVAAGVIQGIGKYVTYQTKEDGFDLGKILNDENLLEQFIVGAVTSGIVQTPGLVKATQGGRDFVTNYTQNEQKVIDKEVENRIVEAQKDGKILNNKEITKIQEEVKQQLEKGYISLDTIESTLGGETYNKYKSLTDKKKSLESEINKLENKKLTETTVKDNERLQDLRKQLSELDTDSVKSQLSTEVDNLTQKDAYLRTSYNERANKGVNFQADLTKYDEKQQKVVKKAIDSGILNNTNKTHDFVDMIAKISADKGVDFDFTNNENLKNSGFAVEGKSVNGFVKNGSITLNIESSKALNSVVGHEITHVLEGTELYGVLKDSIKEYATMKGEYDTRLAEVKNIYKNVKNADVEGELTADLVGDYIFSDPDFVKTLSTKQPNVFQKIYNEIKYLYKIATAGSTEAKQLEKVKKAFEDAYREKGQVSENTKLALSENALSEVSQVVSITREQADTNGTQFVKLKDNTIKQLVDYGVKDLPMLERVGHVRENILTEDEAKKLGYSTKNKHYHGLGVKTYLEIIDSMDKPIAIYQYTDKGKYSSDNFIVVTPVEINGKKSIVPVEINNKGQYNQIEIDFNKIKSTYLETKENYLQDMVNKGKIKEIFTQSSAEQTSLDADNIPQNTENVKDSQGRELTKEQQSFFKDSKIRDENGNLKVVYHGTRADFNVFESERAGQNYENGWSQSGKGFYFTDNQTEAQEFGDYSLGKADTQVKEVYLNIANPFDTSIEDATLLSEIGKEYGVDPQFTQRGDYLLRWFRNNGIDGTEVLKTHGYDGIVDYGHYVAFESNQIKNIDNTNPTSDPDIRYSLSEENSYRGSHQIENAKKITELDLNDIQNKVIELNGYLTKQDYSDLNKLKKIFKAPNENVKIYRASPVNELNSGDWVTTDKTYAKNVANENGGKVYEYEINPNQLYYPDNVKELPSLHRLSSFQYIEDTNAKYSLSEAPTTDNQGRQLTKEQQEYFKDSKVRDENGNLLTVYHGTNNDFTIFENDFIGKNTNNEGIFGKGFYFTEKKSLADGYNRKDGKVAKDGSGKTMELYLDMKKPFYWNDINTKEKMDAFIEETGMPKYVLRWNNTLKNQMAPITDVKAERKFSEVLQQNGYDGVIYKYDDAVGEYVVFNPNQIKNVDNAKPTTSEDIRYSLSNQNDVAPVKNPKLTYGEDVMLQESLLPTTQEVEINSLVEADSNTDIAPIKDELDLTDESANKLEAKQQRAYKKLGSKEDYMSNRAYELYDEVKNLKKGTKASYELSRVLDVAFAHIEEHTQGKTSEQAKEIKNAIWKRVKTSLLNVKAKPLDVVNPNSKIEAAIRENLNREYNSKKKEIDNMKEEDIVTKTKKELRKGLLIDKNDFFIKALDNAKNRSMALMNNTDTIRNTELVFGRENAKVINDLIFQKEIDNEADSIAWQNKERAEIKDLGIKARSKESAAVQKYGEKQYVDDNGKVVEYTDNDLANEFTDIETQNRIKNAAKVIRQKYDNYIDVANGVLTKLGFEPIKKRNDYMRHFQELNDVFSRWGIPFNAQNMQEHTLPTDINGLTEFWSPQKNYFANMQPRKGMKTNLDAITGIDGYIGGIANLIYHTEDIQRGRAFEELIRETYGEDKGWDNLENLPEELQQARAEKIQDNHLSNYAAWVHEWTNNIAGKKNKIDRSVESMFGRKAFTVLDEVRKQVGSNMIGLNLSSSLTNLIAPVQAMAKTNKLAVAKGTADTIKNMFVKDNFMDKNKFLTARMGTDMLSKTIWGKIQDAGFVFMKGMDWFSYNQIVRSKYYELRDKVMNEAYAHAEAGKFAARILGDRTKGANAQLYNSKLVGLVTQFQLEVNNQLYSMFYDTYHESKENAKGNAMQMAAGMTFTLGQLFAFTHLFGQTFESIAGYNPTFDVVEMLKTALGWDDEEDEETTTSERLKKSADMLVDALPYVNILTGGGRIPVASGIPNLVGVATGGKDQYGNELTLEDELKKLLYLIPPTGGNQFKKTTQGLGMFDEDLPVSGSYTDSGNLRFPVEDTIQNRIQAGIFGQWANENARDYFDNERQPLKEKQIQEYADLDIPIADYWKYREGLKEQKTTQEKFDYINSLDVTDEQKNIMINNAITREDTIDMSGYDNFGSYEEFDYATKNPDKYKVIEQIDTFDNYNSYKDDIASIKKQYSTENGYSTEERKYVVQEYINSLNLSVPQKLMLQKMAGGYSIRAYEDYMYGYINSLDMTAEEKQELHKQLFD